MRQDSDVTAALPVSPKFWREVFERAPIAISLMDPEGRQLAGNTAYATLFGYTSSEVEQLVVSQLTRPEDQRWTDGYLQRLRDGYIDSYQTEKVYVRRDGSTFRALLDAHAVRHDGRLQALIGVIVPVREREPLDSGRLRKLVENIHDTITLFDADGRVIETTGRYTPILGYPTEFWEQRSAFDMVIPEDLQQLIDLRSQIEASPGQTVHTTMRVRDAHNEVQYIDAHAVNLLDDPEVGGVVVTTRNITSEHALLEQLRHSRDEAVAEAELRSRMLATVSHELRNPLHVLQGISELLNAGDLADESRQFSEALDRQLRALTRVVDDLLTTSRIELGSMRVELGEVDLRSLVDDVVAIASVAAGRGVVVRSIVDDDVPSFVSTDPVRLRQVLTNLVGNSLKFTDSGSIEVLVRFEDQRLVLVVTDTGTGIPADELASIFEPFRSSTTAGQSAGAGLGLSIVERIVTMLGGSVSVRSAPGAGAVFTVELPSAPSAETTIRHDLGPDAPITGLAGVKVVVVDDDPLNQQLATAQLHALGASSHVVGSGEAGVELLATFAAEGRAVDVVLMDQHLPGIQGTEAVRRIRADELATGRRVPIIGISADASSAHRDRSLAVGMNDHLVKPVSLRQLSAAIQGVLRLGGSPTATEPAAAEPAAAAAAAAETPVPDVNTPLPADIESPNPVLERMADELGDRAVVVEVIKAYLNELDQRVAGIIEAVRTDDRNTAQRLVHTLASGSELLGVGRVGSACVSFVDGTCDENSLRSSASAADDALRAWIADGSSAGETPQVASP
jgi:PAS domain S-box-containing protein